MGAMMKYGVMGLIGAVVLIPMILLAKVLSGPWLLIARIALLLFGAGAIGVVFSRSRKDKSDESASVPLLKERLERLKTELKVLSGFNADLRAQDTVLVVGAAGSTKTSVLASDSAELDEILVDRAGDGSITPTGTFTAWRSRETLYLDVGGGVFADARAWKFLLRSLRPAILSRGLRGRRLPRRSLVVAVSLPELLERDAVEVATDAALIRDRLAATARIFGVRTSVHVLFTKTDAIKGFFAHAKGFQDEVAQQILGATFPVGGWSPADAREARHDEFIRTLDEVYLGLSLNRGRALSALDAGEKRAEGFEFPREFSKAVPQLAHFLTELTRPSSDVQDVHLRGVYFTGIRPVAGEIGDSVELEPEISAARRGVRATGVLFDRDQPRVERARSVATSPGRLPEWVFLSELFRRVFEGDGAAQALAQAGARVRGLRTMVVATSWVIAALLGAGFVTSFLSNRALNSEIEGYYSEFADAASAGRRQAALDSLEGRVRRVAEWGRDGGVPTRYRFGLWGGDAQVEAVAGLYFNAFDEHYGDALLAGLERRLTGLPDEPSTGAFFADTRSALKGYLVYTEFPDSTSADLETPYQQALSAGMNAVQLAEAQRHLRFLAEFGGLRSGPIAEGQEPVIREARRHLELYTGEAAWLELVLDDGRRAARAPRLTVGGSEHAVPPEYTREAWPVVLEAIWDLPSRLEASTWVTGERLQAPTRPDQGDLQETYLARYQAAWTELVRSDAMGQAITDEDRFDDAIRLLATHTQRLDTIRGNGQPAEAVARYFGALRELTSWNAEDEVWEMSDVVLAYQSDLDGWRGIEDEDDAADFEDRVSAVKTAIQSSPAESEPGRVMVALLDQVERSVDRRVQGAGERRMDDAESGFCSVWRDWAAYPLRPVNADMGDDALDEIDTAVQDLLGGIDDARDAPGGASVDRRFTDFASAWDDFYSVVGGDGDFTLSIRFEAVDADRVELDYGSLQYAWTPTVSDYVDLDWPLSERESFTQLRVIADGRTRATTRFGGRWAIFRLFDASRFDGRRSGEVTWVGTQQDLRVVGEYEFNAINLLGNSDVMNDLRSMETACRRR